MNATGMFQNLGFGFLALREPSTGNFQHQLIFRGDLILDPKSDLDVIYHFLKPGSLLVMNYDSYTVSVHYKGFRLGHLSLEHSPDLQRMLKSPNLYKATVTHIRKNKFLPPDSIQIEIHKNF